MKLENRQVPEGINVSEEHPLKEFFALLLGLFLIIVATVVVLALLAQRLAPSIPFNVEQKLLAAVEKSGELPWSEDEEASANDKEIEAYMKTLGARLAAEMDLPEDMELRIHYSADDTLNAFATLGGNVLMYRGLLDEMPHENALAMVMAHEIAHVKLRHPIVAMGRGITVSLALLSMTGFAENNILNGLVNQLGVTSTLGFNRSQERAADAEAMAALKKVYGHIHGAEALFEILADDTGLQPPEFLSTHPKNAERIKRIKAQASADRGELTPLPAFVLASREDNTAPQEASSATE